MAIETRTVLEELIAADDLPTLPVIVHQGLQMLADERTSLREVGERVATDPVLGARMLRLVNSALIGLRRPMNSIPDAVVYLGSDQVRNVLLSSAVVGSFDNPDLNLEPYWEHAFGCGYVASRLSRLLGMGSPDDSDPGGLFHDLGRILLLMRHLDRYSACLDRSRGAGESLCAIEREEFGIDHAEIGAHVAATWRFPDQVVEVVRHHHRPEGAGEHQVGAALVRLADYLCWSRGLIDVAEDLAPTDILEDSCWAVLSRHAPESAPLDPHRLLHEADTMVHEARELVGALYENVGGATPPGRRPAVS